MTPLTPNQPAPAKPEHSALIEATIKKLRTSSGWWEGDPNARKVLGELLNNRSALMAALEKIANFRKAWPRWPAEDCFDECEEIARAAIRNATK